MIQALGTLSATPFATGTSPVAGPPAPGGPGFADALKDGINDVAKLQQDAGQEVTDLVTGRSDNLSGTMAAVEKGDLAFKTLLAIRSKLMDAYEELRGMAV